MGGEFPRPVRWRQIQCHSLSVDFVEDCTEKVKRAANHIYNAGCEEEEEGEEEEGEEEEGEDEIYDGSSNETSVHESDIDFIDDDDDDDDGDDDEEDGRSDEASSMYELASSSQSESSGWSTDSEIDLGLPIVAAASDEQDIQFARRQSRPRLTKALKSLAITSDSDANDIDTSKNL
ncbi:hypothetical protein LTR05_008578 [Lithohypha guttulata]|uniref:Uncharacterized protein n=1 Tax=Lithohypha guttulata TaxID=1690604 RepID=A0AAN7PHI9_9EURO|nr:hypothetical protein LTR05_008578 [Lithohypha guttulata]